MHSYEGPSGRTYHHESHGSFDDVVWFEETVHGQEVTIRIPIRDVLRLAADFVRDRRTQALEEASDEELLGLAAPLTAEVERSTRDSGLGAEIPPGGFNLGRFNR